MKDKEIYRKRKVGKIKERKKERKKEEERKKERKKERKIILKI